MKTIRFTASDVTYNDAIDGEIVQVCFDEEEDEESELNEDVFGRIKCYVMISQNFEFRDRPAVEWYDGRNHDGGSDVLGYKLTDTTFELLLNNGIKFIVQHRCKESALYQIRGFLQREFGNST